MSKPQLILIPLTKHCKLSKDKNGCTHKVPTEKDCIYGKTDWWMNEKMTEPILIVSLDEHPLTKMLCLYSHVVSILVLGHIIMVFTSTVTNGVDLDWYQTSK